MSAETEHYHLENNLTLSDASDSPLTVGATNLSLTKQEDQLIESRLTFCVNPALYQRIDTEAWVNISHQSAMYASDGKRQRTPLN